MITIIGVRFRNVGKVYYFSPRELDICVGDHVIVETARGVEYGFVVLGPKEVDDSKVIQPLKEVIRIATPKDDAREESNRKKEKEAFEICQKKIRAHNLEMKLIDAEYTFDNNKMLFYFTADGRIDFRELVKDLAAVFKTRIELRQIGVRDETKILGGIGICGRLMCCLKNEQETYEYLNRKLPGIGDIVTLPDGMKGEVSGVNVLRQLVKVLVDVNDEKEMRECPVEELKFKPKHKKEKGKEKKKDRNSSGEQASSEEAKQPE